MCYRRKSFWSISIGNGNINVVVCTYLYALRVARSVKSVGLILLATVSVCSMLYASIHAVVQLWFCACELRKISAWMTGTKDCISVKLANHYCGFSFVVVAAFLSKITAANKKTRTLSSTQFNFPDYIFFFCNFCFFSLCCRWHCASASGAIGSAEDDLYHDIDDMPTECENMEKNKIWEHFSQHTAHQCINTR